MESTWSPFVLDVTVVAQPVFGEFYGRIYVLDLIGSDIGFGWGYDEYMGMSDEKRKEIARRGVRG